MVSWFRGYEEKGEVKDDGREAKKLRTRDVMINTLDVRRGSGKTWLDDLNKAFMPCYPTTDGKAFDFPKLQWYHDGVAWCLKNKLMTNHKDGTFGVSETASRATRAETAVMITRFHVAMERSQKESLCRFPDEAGGWRTIMFTTSHFLWMGITVLVIPITSFLLAMVLMQLYHMPFLLKNRGRDDVRTASVR